MVLLAMLWPAAMFAAVTPYPPYPGALPSVAYQVAVAGRSEPVSTSKPSGHSCGHFEA